MADRYWVGGTGNWNTTNTTNWSASPGGASGASVPTAADSVFFDRTGTYTVTIGGGDGSDGNCLNLTVSAGTVAFQRGGGGGGGNLFIYGSMSLIATTTFNQEGMSFTFGATTAGQTITTNGVVLRGSCTFNGVGGSWILQDAVTLGFIEHINGTINLNGKTLTTSGYQTFTGTKNITFNGGSLVLTDSGGSPFNNTNSSGFSTTAGTGTGTISMTGGGTNTKTFIGGNSTFNCTLNLGGAGTGALTITGNNTFNNITNTAQPITILFTAGTTTTFNNFNLSGTAGNPITIGSATAASHTLSKSSGTVSVNYLSISRSTATGGATWTAANSTNGGNNTGWIITAPIPGVSLATGLTIGNGITFSY